MTPQHTQSDNPLPQTQTQHGDAPSLRARTPDHLILGLSAAAITTNLKPS